MEKVEDVRAHLGPILARKQAGLLASFTQVSAGALNVESCVAWQTLLLGDDCWRCMGVFFCVRCRPLLHGPDVPGSTLLPPLLLCCFRRWATSQAR